MNITKNGLSMSIFRIATVVALHVFEYIDVKYVNLLFKLLLSGQLTIVFKASMI